VRKVAQATPRRRAAVSLRGGSVSETTAASAEVSPKSRCRTARSGLRRRSGSLILISQPAHGSELLALGGPSGITLTRSGRRSGRRTTALSSVTG